MAHPKIKVEATRTEKVCNLISMLAIIGMCGYTFYMFHNLPDTIPIHFNGIGEPNEWGDKATIFLLPIIVTILFIGMYMLMKFPHIFNYPIKITEENAPRVYLIARQLVALINVEIVALFTTLQIDLINSARSGMSSISFVFAILFIFIPLITCIVFIMRLNNVEK